jgi:chromosome partitioning protein
MPPKLFSEDFLMPGQALGQRGHIVVVGNAKGGSGKSTTAMHIIARLLAMGRRVGAIDLDGQQQTLGRYLENRVLFAQRRGLDLPVPEVRTIVAHRHIDQRAGERQVYSDFCGALEDLVSSCDAVVIDCPGSDNFIARLGHNVADTLVTPMNDSFIDIDLLARIDPETFAVIRPSWYSEMVWELRKRRFMQDRHTVDWVLLRNRLSHTDARNKRHVLQVLQKLAPRFGYRLVPGFGERVIFRELFLKGLTLSDLRQYKTGVPVTMAHIAAHQEIKGLVHSLRLAPMQAAQIADMAEATRAVG